MNNIPRLLWTMLVAGSLLLFWSPLLTTPFWQDDYMLLYFAREAAAAGEPWYSSLAPRLPSIFWRPLSEGVYWRLIENRLGADPVLAHSLNLTLLVASALAVGWFAATLVRRISPAANATAGGLLGAFLYGIHGAHFLPIAWATAAHTPMAVLFSALALRFWIAGLDPSGRGGGMGLLLVPVFFLLALFSKESALLTAAAAALLTIWLWPEHRPTRTGWGVMASCALVALVWLLIRKQVTVPPTDAYEMTLGVNVLRNSLNLALFFFNVPREALRFVLVEHSVAAGIWAISCLLLQAAAFWLLARGSAARLGRKGTLILVLCFLVSCAPYFLLAWNTYAYYITLGLTVWAVIAAVSAADGRTRTLAVAAALLSSVLAVGGSLVLEYPALMGRAAWAERQLEIVRAQLPEPPDRLYVRAENRHRYLGFGPYGLAYALAMPVEGVVELAEGQSAPVGSALLLVPADGDVRIRHRRPPP